VCADMLAFLFFPPYFFGLSSMCPSDQTLYLKNIPVTASLISAVTTNHSLVFLLFFFGGRTLVQVCEL
jgi:hypothetical protein